MQINPQPVMSPAGAEVPQNAKEVTQPNVTINAEGTSAALPGMPADLASQTPPTSAAQAGTPAKQAATPPTSATPTSNRTVAPLPNVTPTPTQAAKPNAPTNVTMPQIAAGQAPATASSNAPAASTAAPAAKTTSGATTQGAQSVPANAKAAPPPPPAQLPKQAMTPGTAAPQTPATPAPEPNIPAVRAPGGDGAPNPSGMVPSTANLGADRTNASQQLTAEAQTQSKVGPEANTQKQAQVASQKPAFEQTKRSGDAPRQQAVTASTTQGQQASEQGKSRGAQTGASANAQIAAQAQSAAAERSAQAAQAASSAANVMAQSSPAVMKGASAPAQAAVTSAATAAQATPVIVNPSAVARAGQAAATPSQLPPFDAARFNQIDQVPPTPETNMQAADASKQAAEQTYQQANQQIDQLTNIQPPQINAPQSAAAGQVGKDGKPTREAAIGNIEQQVTAQAQAQGPAKMQEAARPLQQEVKQHATSAQQAATTSADTQLQQHEAKSQQIKQQPPPITGAQAAAQAQPQYQAHQAEATAAQTNMQTQIAGAQTAANASAQQAKQARDQQLAQAQAQYAQQSTSAQGEYASAQQAAKGNFDSQNQAAQQAMASDQQQAQAAAQQQTAAAQAKNDADIAQQHAQLQSQQQQANASHQQQMEAANQQHDAQVQAAQSQMDSDVASKQSEMQSQVASEQSRGQQEVDQHLTEGEQGYQREIQSGEQQANAEKARAEQEARAKEQQAQAEKDKHSGGIFGKVVGWVKDRFNDLMNAAKAVLAAARDLIVSIMEKARQAAIAVLQKARQAALAALAKVKSAIQGIISAAASAIRSIISACAQMVRNLIQNLANMLKSLVQALTTLLTTLVQAFQAAVNALLDGLIAAVSLINKDLGDKLRSATQKYRDAFNNAMNNLQSGIKAAGDALQAKIQQAADGAIAVVNAAEQTLNAAVTRVEQTLNAAVEAAYQVGAAAINKAFDAAEAVVNKAFEVAEAAVKAYFDAQIAALDLVQQGVNAVADFVIAVADKVLEAVAKIAEAIVNLIPESWTKWFVDFWNGPWRTAIIIGLATVAAVAITVATCGAAGPVAMILVAGVIGGTLAGGAYFGGELLAREGAIDLAENHPGEGIYVPGVGFQQIKLGPDGKPVMPEGLTEDQQAAWEKNSQWAISNFNTQKDAEGNVTGFERKSGSEIANYAVQEGIKGFGEGFVSAAGAMGGSLAGGAVAGLGFVGRVASNPIARQMIASAVEGGVGVVSQSVGAAWTAGFDAMAEGKSPAEAFSAAWKAGSDSITDPGNWVSALASVGVIPLKTKALGPLLDKVTGRVANQAVKTVIKEGTDVVVDTMAETLGNAGGSFVSTYYKAINEGKTPAQAMEEAKKAANDAFKPEQIIQSLAMNTAGNIANKQAERYAERKAAASGATHTDATPDGPGHPVTSDNPPHHDSPDGQPRSTRGGDESNPTPRTTESDSTEVQRQKPPAGQKADTPDTHSDQQTTRRPVDEKNASETPQRRVDDTQQKRDTAPARKSDADTADTQPQRDRDGQTAKPDETKPHQIEDTQQPAKTNDPVTKAKEAHDVEVEAQRKQQQIEEPPPLRDRIDEVTGVKKGDKYEQDMQALRDFYRQQEIEAQTVVRVETDRTDQMIDPKTGQPLHRPDGTPYGYGIKGDYDVRRFTYDGQNLTQVTIKVHLAPGQGVDAAMLAKVKADTHAGVDKHYNQDHKLANGDRLNVNIEFVTNPADAHLQVDVGAGKGRADQKHWFVDSDPTVHAHELGHQMGLLDEYHDPNTVRRNDPNSPHVMQDGSLMGNFYTRDAAGNVIIDPNTSLKDRHLAEIGRDIDDSRREGRVDVNGKPPPEGQAPNAPKHQQETSSERFQDRQTDQARIDQQMSEKGHSGIEVHSHFMGNVEPSSFANTLAKSGDAPMRHPNAEGTTASQRLGDHSIYEPVMREIAQLNDFRHQTTTGPNGETIISQRGRSGDAIAQIDAAQARIETLKQQLEAGKDTLSPAEKTRLKNEIHEEARSAVEKALRASDETDFNSSYEVRDELVKKFYGAAERNAILTANGVDPKNAKMTDPKVVEAYQKHFEGRQEILDRIPAAAEAERRLAAGDFKDKAERKQLEKQANSIKEQMAYDQYAKETLLRLAQDGITYTEQSNSINKIGARFDEGQIDWLKAQLIKEHPEMAQAIQNLTVKHVTMINTNQFGVRGDEHKGAGSQVKTDDLHPAAKTARGSNEDFTDAVKQLVEQTRRGDVVGVDIAGAEHFTFDGEGQRRMTELYDALLKETQNPSGTKPIVLRPHVGEGANDVVPGQIGHRDANRQMVDGPNGPELSHYARARENLDNMLKVFEAIAARPENGGKLPPDVIVRFGHATHTTPEMAARMAKLGIIAEVNLTSNIETGSVSQKKPQGDTDNVHKPGEKPELYESDPKKRGGSLDDHALASLIAADAPIILSTDAHAVMNTNMANEYARAKSVIEEVRSGRRKVGIDESVIDPQNGVPGRVRQVSYDEMPQHLKDRFDRAERKLYEDANRYYDMRPKQDGDGPPPPSGPGPTKPGPEDAPTTTGLGTSDKGLTDKAPPSPLHDGQPPSAVRAPKTDAEKTAHKQINESTDLLRQKFGDRIADYDATLVPPPDGRPVLQQNQTDALIGLPAHVIPAEMSGADALAKLQQEGIPRWGGLTAKERGHETAFASHVEANMPAAVAEYTKRSFDDKVGTYIFEVDAAKKLYEAYGAGKGPANPQELDVRASANHALHPAAVAVARVAFLDRLDQLAGLPDGDPRKAIFVTNGGCASGKGSLSEIIKNKKGGKFEFGAVWDAAGEGDAQENGWILKAAQARGLKVSYGMVESDPNVTYNGVLERADSTGRIVDPLTFARSYVRGQENMRAFLDSPEYKAALAKGEVDAVGVYTGRFDMKTKSFPDMHLLGDEGRIGADHLGKPMDEAAVTKRAIEIFDEFLKRREAEGKATDHWFEGGAVNPLKFGDQPTTPKTAETDLPKAPPMPDPLPPAPAPPAPDATTAKPKADERPASTTDLAAILEKNKTSTSSWDKKPASLEELKGASKEQLKAVAKQLLQAKGIKIENDSDSQLVETIYQLKKAADAGDATFEAPFEAGAIKKVDGVNERLGNIFGEKKVFDQADLTADKLRMTPEEKAQLEGGYESGTAGMVKAASFINTRHRAEGDFSQAYGADAWKNFLKAESYLNSMPKGSFIDGLSIEVMQETNRLIHTPDTGMKAQILRGLAYVGRGFRWDKGGEVREGKQYARPEHYSPDEIENLHEAGVRTKEFPLGMGTQLQYPDPEQVRPRLNALIAELKAELAKPNADPIAAAAQFQRHFVALHPFGDSNGRTSRVLMNRILSEFDMPPAIFADQNKDMSLSPKEWRDEVAKGVARSKEFLKESGSSYGNGKRYSKDEYASTMGVAGVASPNKPITVDGMPFDLGKDGLLYDPTGRPHIVKDGAIIPMSQLEHIMFSRRIGQAGADAGGKLLAEHTSATRDFYEKVAADPDAAKGVVVNDDARARKADQEYRLNPDPEVAAMLTKLSDMSVLDPKKAFAIGGGDGRGTRTSAVLSKYTQMDLELWYIEKGLRDSKQPDMVEQVRANRAKLFEMAKAELLASKDATRVSAENPEGFKYRYEKMMYDTSPLRFGSFDEAIGELGDKRMTIWRGDYSFAKLIGMAPNNDIRQPDAKKVSDQRADKGQITNLYDDLMKLEGSAVGRQYICTTSDLALLVHAFADSSKAQTVNLGSVPGPIRERLLGWMDPNFPDGTTAEDKAKARQAALDKKSWVVPTADGKGKEIRDAFGIPGVILKLEIVDKAKGEVKVTADRKAFRIDIDKDAMLPGIVSLGGHSFESEQEIHGLEAVRPWKIKSTHAADELKQEFPVNGAPTATPTPASPDSGTGAGHAEGGAVGTMFGIGKAGDGDVAAPAVEGADKAKPLSTGANIEVETAYEAKEGGRKRTTVGVGEVVYFTSDVEGTFSSSVGSGKADNSQQYTWTAPGKKTSATITFRPSGGGTPVTTSIDVITPTSVKMTKKTDDSFGKGVMGAGFRAKVTFHPLNVSFAATQWKEDTGQAGEAASGYFVGKSLPTHEAAKDGRGIGDGNTGPGDHAAFGNFPKPWDQDGSFKWAIGQNWELRDGSASGFIETLDQVCEIKGPPHAGRTTVTKGGASSTRDPDGTTGGGGGKGGGKGEAEADGPPTSLSAFGEGLSSEGATNHTESLDHEVGGRGLGHGEATATTAVTTAAPSSTALLIDKGSLAPGQMLKSTFLVRLEQEVIAVANTELGRIATVAGCPYIEKAFAKYGALPADAALAMIARWVPASRGARNAEELIPLVLERVREGVRQWKENGTLPSDLATADPGLAAQAQTAAKGKGIGLGSLESMEGALGDGEPVDSRIARGMSEATGVDVSHARVHRGVEAAGMAAAHDATAFAVGSNIVMGADAPASGTGIGDALLAHELAHVAQQRDAASDPSQRRKPVGAEDQGAERDANQVAGTGLAALSNFGAAVGNVMRTGVQLQRCPGPQPAKVTELRGKAAESKLAELGGLMVTDPDYSDNHKAVVGSHVQYTVLGVRSKTTTLGVHQWTHFDPDGNRSQSITGVSRPDPIPGEAIANGMFLNAHNVGATTMPLSKLGTYKTQAWIRAGVDNNGVFEGYDLYVDHSIEVTHQLRATHEAYLNLPKEIDSFQKFHDVMDVQTALLRPGGPDQQNQGHQLQIKTSAANPATAATSTLEFSVHDARTDKSKPLTYHWYISPQTKDKPPEKLGGRSMATVGGRVGYDFGAGPSIAMPADYAGFWVIWYQAKDDKGAAAGEATYFQTVLAEADVKALAKHDKYMSRLDELGDKIQGERAPIKGVHVASASGAATQLRLFVGKKKGEPSTFILIDVTPGLDPKQHRLEYTSSTGDGAVREFIANNKYPKGMFRYHVALNKLGIDSQLQDKEASGEGQFDRLSRNLSVGGMVVLGLGILAAPVTRGQSLQVALVLSGGLTAAGAAVSLYDRLQNAEVSGTGVALDVITIASSLINAGAAVRALRAGPGVLLANRATRFLLWANVAADGVSALLIAAEGVEQIAAIIDDEKMRPEQKRAAVMRVVTNLVMTGALFAVSASQLRDVRGRLKGLLGAGLMAKLGDADAMALSMLDDATVRSIKVAAEKDATVLGRVSGILRDEPALMNTLRAEKRLATVLSLLGGSKPEDLRFAIMRVNAHDAGVSVANSDRLVSVLKKGRVESSVAMHLPNDSLAHLGNGATLDKLEAIGQAANAGNLKHHDTWLSSLLGKKGGELETAIEWGVEARKAAAHHKQVFDLGGADPQTNALLKDRTDLRWQMNNKNEREIAKGNPPRYTDLDVDVNKGMDTLAMHRARGYCAGFTDKAHFERLGAQLKREVAAATPPAGGRQVPTRDIVVQGSAVHQPVAKDVDIAILVTPNEFNALLEQSFATRVAAIRARGLDPFTFTMAQAKSSAEETFAHAVEQGKITRDKVRPRLSDVRDNATSTIGGGTGVDLSVIKRGGKFDHGPYFPF